MDSPQSSISSLHDTSMPATPPRFSVNSNLMNYSIPKHSSLDTPPPLSKAYHTATTTPYNSHDKREIQLGNSDTRTRLLEAQIEQLTLSNVKLQRANRLLKVDTDNVVEERTQPLRDTIRDLMLSNVQLQRSTRLLQQEVDERNRQFQRFQADQIRNMKNVGPEYEYLVQMINLLHRQLNGDANCDETCCFTSAPVDQSTVVMTLPPERDGGDDTQNGDDDEDQAVEAQHICRPVIHSSISQGSYAAELELKIAHLEAIIDAMDLEKEANEKQLRYKDDDLQMLKKELQIKDEVISQLEQDFLDLEEKLTAVQHKPSPSPVASLHSPSPPPDPRRQSQLLMESKRRSLAIKDTSLLEQMLRGDLNMDQLEEEASYDHHHEQQPRIESHFQRDVHESDHDQDDDELEEDDEELELHKKDHAADISKKDTLPPSPSPSPSASPQPQPLSRSTSIASTASKQARIPPPRATSISSSSSSSSSASSVMHAMTWQVFEWLAEADRMGQTTTMPCSLNHAHANTTDPKHTQAAILFVAVTVLLSLTCLARITDDWTLPLTLAILVSSFLWSGGARGIQLKVKLK